MKRLFLFFFMPAILLVVTEPNVHAINFDVQGMRFGINGYIDLEYTYMGKLPTDGFGGFEAMDEQSYLDQNHMNLLFDAEKDKFRAHLNLESTHAYTTEERGTEGSKDRASGGFEIEDAYGEYTFNDLFKLRAGYFLMPFGIYNEVHYIASLFSTVVLPQMYHLPKIYKEAPIIDGAANFMASGRYLGKKAELDYSLYVGNGQRGEDGIDKNKDKLLGGRIRLTVLNDSLKFGVSYLTVDDSNYKGRNNLYGADLDITIFDRLNLLSEYAYSEYEYRKSKYSYYVRLVYISKKFSPFIAYDYFRDKDYMIYENGATKWSIGTGYDFTDNIILKGEYDYHVLSKPDDISLPSDTDKTHMFRASVSFVF